jgi:hypothetical protein
MSRHEFVSFPDHGGSGLRPGQLLELVIAELRRRIEPDATVEQNVILCGSNALLRQCDVVARRSLDSREHLTIVECKDRTRPVGIAAVDALATVRVDLGADLAILVSPSGFTRGARAQAASKGIVLHSMRGATDEDWERLFGRPTMVPFAMVVANDVRYGAVPMDGSAVIPVGSDAEIVKPPNRLRSTAKQLFDDAWPSIQPVEGLGWVILTLDLIDGSELRTPSGLAVRVNALKIAVEAQAVQYLLDARLFGGAVLADWSDESLVYAYLSTTPLDWREALLGLTPRVLTNEEYLRMRVGMIDGTHPTIDPRELKQYLRLHVELVCKLPPDSGGGKEGRVQPSGDTSSRHEAPPEG